MEASAVWTLPSDILPRKLNFAIAPRRRRTASGVGAQVSDAIVAIALLHSCAGRDGSRPKFFRPGREPTGNANRAQPGARQPDPGRDPVLDHPEPAAATAATAAGGGREGQAVLVRHRGERRRATGPGVGRSAADDALRITIQE